MITATRATKSGPAKILVVDDEEFFLGLFKRNFRSQIKQGKYQFSYCSIPQEVFRRIKNNRPDLVLMDLEMPGLNGFELMDQLKKTHFKIPIIVLSTFGDKAHFRQAMHRRAFDFLTKPINFQELETTIDLVLKLNQDYQPETKVITIRQPSPEEKLQDKVTPTTVLEVIETLRPGQQYFIVQKLIEKFNSDIIQDLRSDLDLLLIEVIEDEQELKELEKEEFEREAKGLLPLRWIREGRIDKRVGRKKLASGKYKEYGPFFYFRRKNPNTGRHESIYLGTYQDIVISDPTLARIIKKEYRETVAEIEAKIKQFQRSPGENLPNDDWEQDGWNQNERGPGLASNNSLVTSQTASPQSIKPIQPKRIKLYGEPLD